MSDPLRFERRFALWGAALTVLEAAAIGGPLYAFFTLDERQRWLLHRAAPVVLPGAWLCWWLVMRFWRAPIERAVSARRAAVAIDPGPLQLAARTTLLLPRRAALLRALMTTLAALALTGLLVARAGLPPLALLTVASVAAFAGLTVQVFRALAWARVLDALRGALVPEPDALRQFRDLYRPRLWRAALATGALAVAATAAFAVFFLPISVAQYRELVTWFPLTILALTLVWLAMIEQLTGPVERFLDAATASDPRRHPGRDDPDAGAAFEAAQWLPYKLGAVKLAIALFGQILLGAQAIVLFAVDTETAMLLFGEALVVTVGATLYEVLWHRNTLRPLLAYLAVRHRPLPGLGALTGRPPLGLRTKMLLAFGALTLFACGLSLLWSFVQYKTLATAFIQRESEQLQGRIVRALAGRLDGSQAEAEAAVVALLAEEARGPVLLSYYPPDPLSPPQVFGGAPAAAAPLPRRDVLRVRTEAGGALDAPDVRLAGTFVRLADGAGHPRGALVVLLPGYRGRGAPIAQPLRLLVFFFVFLLLASMGVVVLVANDLTRPIRLLEQRADAMARGDLNRPAMQLTGELDEVGRLTVAFEEMRRALDEKLRSSTEINLSLEQEVSRRTAELSRRNRELADALDALRRAQAELVRSEKMASMGRLVAGIAHEINNPVNALVNTVGPLEASVSELVAAGQDLARRAEAGDEVAEMIRVIRSGARRTKEIVSALHNYSRGDDNSVTPVDIHRRLDESLDLLRHHLRHGIRVERNYGEVGQVVGNEGQLQQVFMNLLTNAAQAIGERPSGGTISLSTERAGPAVIIRVSDDGPGIPDEILPRIFDPFFTTKDVGEGSGLGLSIVHGIVERHHGSISVESRLGQGTTFTVELPVSPPERDRSGPHRIAG